METLQQGDDERDWTPLFEPNDFNNNKGPLNIRDYQLSTEQLQQWGERCSQIREFFMMQSHNAVMLNDNNDLEGAVDDNL